MVSVLQNERTQLWFHLHTHMLWENILLSSWTYKKWQVFRLDSRTLPLICRLYNQILCVFHVARTKYKQQSEINSYIKGGQELPDFAALLQQKLWDFFFYYYYFWLGWWGWNMGWIHAGPRQQVKLCLLKSFLCTTRMQVKGRQRKTSLRFLCVVRGQLQNRRQYFIFPHFWSNVRQ